MQVDFRAVVGLILGVFFFSLAGWVLTGALTWRVVIGAWAIYCGLRVASVITQSGS